MNSCGQADNRFFGLQRFTGKERDQESGLDYFGARYFGSALGRFTSPDPLMASAKAWDPQTWNRYSYARNNPLALIDPTGMAEVSAAACAQDKHCVTVNVNVIYDKNANDGQGLTNSEKASFEKNQLQKAKDEYGDADIHLNVSYSEGAVTRTDTGLNITGLKAGALNVVATDQVLPDQGQSGMSGKTAVSLVNPNSGDLPHEMAHQFTGDTRGVMGALRNLDIFNLLNTYNDYSNNFERAWMRGLEQSSGPMSHYPLASVFNHDAAVFQKVIQPTTKPRQ